MDKNQCLRLEIPSETRLADFLIQQGVAVPLPCGGNGSCGKCKATVTGAVAPPTDAEKRLLSAEELQAGVRLLCRARSSGGVVVFHSLPDSSLVSVLVDGYQHNDAGAPSNLRGTLAAEPCPTEHPVYGVACDIGTTTLVAYLVDLTTGDVVDALPDTNPQAAHGSDVMSRISYAASPSGLEQLHKEIVSAFSKLISRLAKSNDIPLSSIKAVTAVGNTCMHHLFLDISPVSLGQAPYRPVTTTAQQRRGRDIGLHLLPEAVVWVGPVIGGFVGADAVAAAIAGSLHSKGKPRLLLDLGTNGEILLSFENRLLACSAAVGPAFEGGNISCGLRAVPGAIDAVKITPAGVKIHVLGDGFPTGICGSGLVDAVASLLELGLIDETGRLATSKEVPDKAKAIVKNLIETEEGLAFRLTAGDGDVPAVHVTQKDIREIQLAKGAIKAAIQVLCSEVGISTDDIDQVLLAGGFGNYIGVENGVRLGLLPPLPRNKIRAIGNAAGAGAILALLSQAARDEFSTFAVKAEHVELNLHPNFQDKFMDSLFFAG